MCYTVEHPLYGNEIMLRQQPQQQPIFYNFLDDSYKEDISDKLNMNRIHMSW